MKHKRPKLWNGPHALGEGLVRGLELTGSPYLSASTGDGVYAGVMHGKGEVKFKQEKLVGGFISRPQSGALLTPVFWGKPFKDGAGTDINPPLGTEAGEDPHALFRATYDKTTKTAGNPYVVRRGQPDKYGTVDWQGKTPKNVLSWDAMSWIGPVASRWEYGYVNPQGGAASATDGAARRVPVMRYQCVGVGTSVYRNLDTYLTAPEVVHGAAIVKSIGTKKCIVAIGTDAAVKIGFLDAEGEFTQISAHNRLTTQHFMTQGWYFNSSGDRAVCMYSSGSASYVVEFALGEGETLAEVQAASTVTVIEQMVPATTWTSAGAFEEVSSSNNNGVVYIEGTENFDYQYSIRDWVYRFSTSITTGAPVVQSRVGRDYVDGVLTRLDIQVPSIPITSDSYTETGHVEDYEFSTPRRFPDVRSMTLVDSVGSSGQAMELAASGGASFSVATGTRYVASKTLSATISEGVSGVEFTAAPDTESINYPTFSLFRLLHADLRSSAVAGIMEEWVDSVSATNVANTSGSEPTVDTTGVTTKLRKATLEIYVSGALVFSHVLASGSAAGGTETTYRTFASILNGHGFSPANDYSSSWVTAARNVPAGNNFYLGIGDEFFGASYFSACFLSGLLTFSYAAFDASATGGSPEGLSFITGDDPVTLAEISGYPQARFWKIGVV